MDQNHVLVAILNGDKVVDSGSGMVLGTSTQADDSLCTFVLTCYHNLKSLRRYLTNAAATGRILVNGCEAQEVDVAALRELDLAVLKVAGQLGAAVPILASYQPAKAVHCIGYVNFYGEQFECRQINAKADKPIQAKMVDGRTISYLPLRSTSNKEFSRGFSGAPVYSHEGAAIGIGRILDSKKINASAAETVAYALLFDDAILENLRAYLPAQLAGLGAQVSPEVQRMESAERPPEPPKPLVQSVQANDLQKGRWGGQASDFEFELKIENVRMLSRSFTFDIVLEAIDEDVMQPPVVFYLHDSFSRSVIWIRKIRDRRAVLEYLDSKGTFAFGVQFRDSRGQWRKLEYDLTEYKDGILKRYDKEKSVTAHKAVFT